MPRVCTICTHLAHVEIDQSLITGEVNRRIAARFGISETSLRRHRAEHLPVGLIKAQEAGQVAQADDLLTQLRDLQATTLSILATAEGTGKLAIALMAIREARGNIELFGRLTKQLQDSPTVNILINPQWVSVRALLMNALQEYPEARVAVAASLQQLEGGGA